MRAKRIVGLIGLLGLVLANLAAAADFSRYAVILSRRPFASALPEEPPPAPVVVSDEPPPFVRQLRLVALTESPAGLRAGFLNLQHRPPRVHYLYVGESEDGFSLLAADYDRERALVAKGEEQYWLRMGMREASAGTEVAAAQVADEVEAAVASRGRGAVIRAGAAAPEGAPGEGQESYAERRRQRLAEMRRRAEESRRLSEEEVERQLREYQMRLIREGRTPLPIPITEEMDAQLVAEGILPPVE